MVCVSVCYFVLLCNVATAGVCHDEGYTTLAQFLDDMQVHMMTVSLLLQ